MILSRLKSWDILPGWTVSSILLQMTDSLHPIEQQRVLVYIQEKNFIDPSKLTSVGYGDNWPVADNYTPEGRSANRRVEVLITKTGAQYKNLGELYKEIQYGTDTDEGQE